jgi:5,10-methenyltetrahydromethanopterin hydrogenase
MAERLLDLGFSVDVWDRTAGQSAHLAEQGAIAHPEAAQAVADAEVVLTMLPTGDAVTDVMLHAGTVDALPPSAVWAQMGTIGLEATERINAEVVHRRPTSPSSTPRFREAGSLPGAAGFSSLPPARTEQSNRSNRCFELSASARSGWVRRAPAPA